MADNFKPYFWSPVFAMIIIRLLFTLQMSISVTLFYLNQIDLSLRKKYLGQRLSNKISPVTDALHDRLLNTDSRQSEVSL